MTTPSQRSGSTTTWWLYYLITTALGICAGVALFDWVAG